jgi:fido (protein-threonine AMPylation protein)
VGHPSSTAKRLSDCFYGYDAGDDPLCYPGTTVLRNKANLTDQDELDQFEQLMFLTRSEEPLPEGALDYAHYRAIHRKHPPKAAAVLY